MLAQSCHTSGMLSPMAAPDLRDQIAETRVQALVDKAAACELAIEPCARFSVHWHRPCESVREKGSRSIPAMQQSMRSLNPLGYMWVIESRGATSMSCSDGPCPKVHIARTFQRAIRVSFYAITRSWHADC